MQKFKPVWIVALVWTAVGIALLPFPGWTSDHSIITAGIAWKVQGDWTAKGSQGALQTGDAVLPGSLLQPAGLDNAHSLTVLLPDGQQFLYECFTPEDCARGFRVPALVEKPSAFALEMMARIRSSIKAPGAAVPGSAAVPVKAPRTRPAMDEAVMLLGAQTEVPVKGLLAALPNGSYTYVLRSVRQAAPQPEKVRTWQKSSGTCEVPVPGAGLYDMVVSDAQAVPRVDMYVAVLDARQAPVLTSYSEARKLLDSWNENFTGWPVHELLRAYLQSWLNNPNAKG